MDAQPTQMPPPLAEAFVILSDDVQWLHAHWKIYRELFGTNPQRVELLNRTAPFFFHELERVLKDDVILAICKLLDGRKGNLVLSGLLRLLDRATHQTLYEELQQRLKSLDSKSLPFVENRNKRIAHRDRAVALGHQTTALPRLPRAEVEDFLGELRGFLNAIQAEFD
ncbi:MAG: hypothetical protein NTW86_32670, partial [Candidatus Sumerlaeota bacterium]|nr:hypothetical protein [Candidatus Sumerlaeota bacterium]